MTDVPVQFFQSVIALQLAVTGALLWNLRYFDRRPTRPGPDVADDAAASDGRTNPWVALAVSVVLVATLFGSLYAIRHEAQERAATAVTIGLSLSMVPILLRVLPPIRTHHSSGARTTPVTVVGLLVYAAAVAILVVVLNG